jgi:tRNA(Arg) A34 adenosine deaminase TadA
MCAVAISFARQRRLFFGVGVEKGGGVVNGVRFFTSPTCHHAPDVYASMAETESAAVLRNFFRERREP